MGERTWGYIRAPAELSSVQASKIKLPWLDEPLPPEEAVETLARAFDEDADETEDRVGRVDELSDRVDELEERLESLDGDEATVGSSESTDEEVSSADEESTANHQHDQLSGRVETIEECVEASNNGSSVTCPDCKENEQVLKAGVAAAVLVENGSLSDSNVRALNEASHLCLSCRKAFTPCQVGS